MVTNTNNKIKTIIYWIIVIVLIIAIIVLIGFIIFGKIYTPSQGQTFIKPKQTSTSPICQQQPIKCNGPDDITTCQNCIDNVEITCQELYRTKDQEPFYGTSGYFCLPQKPSQPCDPAKGGIWEWTGWASTDRMEWDCLCTYPGYAGNPGCTKWNPNVCNGGIFSYDATKQQNQGPSINDCTCATGYNLLSADPGGIPICVPAGDYLCKDKTMCETMYSNSTFVSK